LFGDSKNFRSSCPAQSVLRFPRVAALQALDSTESAAKRTWQLVAFFVWAASGHCNPRTPQLCPAAFRASKCPLLALQAKLCQHDLQDQDLLFSSSASPPPSPPSPPTGSYRYLLSQGRDRLQRIWLGGQRVGICWLWKLPGTTAEVTVTVPGRIHLPSCTCVSMCVCVYARCYFPLHGSALHSPAGTPSSISRPPRPACIWPVQYYLGRIWWSEATRLEDPLDISNGIWTPKSSGERDGLLSLV
jgi:hypothetical protein